MHSNTDSFLQAIGLKESDGSKPDIQLYCINNRDGSPRWIWNAQNPRPDFLRFYSQGSLRSKAYGLLIQTLFMFRLQHLVFGRNRQLAGRCEAHPLAAFTRDDFALFTGTAGPNRKLILFAAKRFFKIALNEPSASLIANEAAVLKRLEQRKHSIIPEVENLGFGILSLTDLGTDGKRSGVFSPLHAAALKEMQGFRPDNCIFRESAVYRESLQKIQDPTGHAAHRIPANLPEKLLRLSASLAEECIPLTFAHRDFTPWNCYVREDVLLVYDFELSHPFMPFGYDALHFVMQQSVLVERLPWKQIKLRLASAFDMLLQINNIKADVDTCLRAYLLIHISYYLDLYRKQENWHTQIHWQLDTWQDALSDILCHAHEPRALLIEDLFSQLEPGTYAAIKFPEIPPGNLSPLADIDLLIEKARAQQLLRHLRQHPLVRKTCVQKQSHMMHVQLILENGQLLAVDLIWQLKRKALQFMDTKEIIASAVSNAYGVSCMHPEHTFQYLRCFYGLNGETIPVKYRGPGEEVLPSAMDTAALKREIRGLPLNAGFSGLKHRVLYVADVVRRLLRQRGMVVTFSGVDGAGKSTVIAHTRDILEKKLRRPVVVIRHRPSVLPILSAWKEGKQQAEAKASNTLPRQGTNNSVISSLFRFTYYFTDYLFGQFYIYIKYILRGKIVLYDRYYFDFINDSRRSNIRLPRWFTKAAYRLLIQPDINFFLYADADTILTRKKELDAPVIRQLTNDYLELFSEMKKKASGRYFSLENLQLQETLRIITSTAEARFFGV